MLEVQKYLMASREETFGPLPTDLEMLEELKESFGIKFNIWNEALVVLNYDQIESPKTHPITLECRSLVLELGTWEVVSRSFDRFFNLGECGEVEDGHFPAPNFGMQKITDLTFHEKMDGSLIGVFYYKGSWLYRTRSVIMPEGTINGFDTTWKERIEEALPVISGFTPDKGGDEFGECLLNPEVTLIGELTCRENRVVVKYEETPKFWLLAVRNNRTGLFDKTHEVSNAANLIVCFNRPRSYTFKTVEDCVQASKDLPNLEEGYVGYNTSGEPVIKVKNPAYVAAHHLRGEGLNEKRILDLIIMNEVDEYLAIFPEDVESFQPYIIAEHKFINLVYSQVRAVKMKFVQNLSQKAFALMIKDEPTAPILFQVRKGQNWKEAFDKMSQQRKRDLILSFKD